MDNQPQQTEQPPIEPPVSPQIEPEVPARKNKKRMIISVVAGLVLIIGGGVTYAILNKKTPTKPSTQANNSSTTAQTGAASLYVYVATKSQNLIVADEQHKTVAKLQLPSGKNDFALWANNAQKVLISAQYVTGGPDANASLYLINRAGKTTQIPSNVAQIIKNEIAQGGSYGFLDNSNKYLYINCSSNNSVLNSLDLDTGDNVAVYTTQTCDKDVYGRIMSSALIGVSPDGTAYLVAYPDGQTKAGTLSLVDIKAQKVTSSFPMANAGINTPVVSPDYKHLVYSPQSNQAKVVYLMDTTTGKTTTVTTNVITGETYDWSPDSTKAGFVTNTIVDPRQVAYLDVASAKVTTFDSYGDPKFNNLQLDGWASDTQLTYLFTKTKTANDFRGGTQAEYVLDTSSGTATAKSVIAGYRLISVGKTSLDF